MEETKKSRSDQGGNNTNKMVIKIGGGGGGGIAAVVLLGGALATAAFASAFVLVGQKRRSSDHNSSPEKDDQRKGAKEEVEMEKDSTVMISAHSLKEDDEKSGDVEARKMEDDAVSDDGFVVVKEEIPLLVEKEEKDKVELITKEDVSINDFSKDSTNLDIENESAERGSYGDGDGDGDDQLCHDQEDDVEAIRADNGVEVVQFDQTKADHKNVNMEKREFGGFCNGNGEINEEKFLESEAIDRAKVDLNDDGIVVSESHDVDGDEPLLPTVAVEMVRVDESIVEYIEEKTVNGCIDNLSTKQNGESEEVGERLEVDAKMNVEKEAEEVLKGLETVKYGVNEEAPGLRLNENGTALVQHPDSQTRGHKNDVEREIAKDVEEELIDCGNGKATLSNMVNGEVFEGAEVMKKTNLVLHTSNFAVKNVIVDDGGGDRSKDLKDEGGSSEEERSMGRGESNWEALWQAEWPKASCKAPQQVKVMSYEVGGKIQEDMAVMKKYEGEMGMVKDHRTSSTRQRMIVWMLSVLSSLSCSWFFDLSCAKICLVVFLTAFLLEIYGYPLMNRRPDQCLHAVKGEDGYEQKS